MRGGFLLRDGLDSVYRPAWLASHRFIVTGVAACRPNLLLERPGAEEVADLPDEADPRPAP